MNGVKPQPRIKPAAMLVALLTTTIFTSPAMAETQVRLQSSNDAAAFSEGYALSVEDWSAKTRQFRARNSSQFSHHSQERPQVWISDIGTLLFDDFDGDSYHSGFSITIDVDSEYGDTEVYANIYLQSDSEALTLLHKTSRFSVYGSTIGDEYRIDTELRNNFDSNNYNVVVDIHDAWSDQLLDTANARGFHNLRNLPLESAEQNQPLDSGQHLDDNHHSDAGSSSADVVVTEYAGAFHPALLLIGMVGWITRREIRRRAKSRQTA